MCKTYINMMIFKSFKHQKFKLGKLILIEAGASLDRVALPQRVLGTGQTHYSIFERIIFSHSCIILYFCCSVAFAPFCLFNFIMCRMQTGMDCRHAGLAYVG